MNTIESEARPKKNKTKNSDEGEKKRVQYILLVCAVWSSSCSQRAQNSNDAHRNTSSQFEMLMKTK